MKIIKAISTLCIAASLYSCNDNSRETTIGNKKEINKTETKNKDIPFSGNWISKNYLDILHATKSPRLATTQHESIHMHIPSKENTEFIIGYNFHEGVPGYKVKKEGDTYYFYNDDEKQAIKIIDDNTIEFKGEKLHKMDNIDSININAVSNYLFNGNYTHNGHKVLFSKDNTISGFEDFKFHELNLDYIGPGLDIDIIQLGTSKNSMRDYGFKFKNNSLEIYDIDCTDGSDYKTDDPCEEIKFGDLKYTLQIN